ncbi:hypothetical protein AAVH_04528 [Aphelenchoides avenae]|nr:hypothetical protein AAVH_04528 [Aphelenchus avenae]
MELVAITVTVLGLPLLIIYGLFMCRGPSPGRRRRPPTANQRAQRTDPRGRSSPEVRSSPNSSGRRRGSSDDVSTDTSSRPKQKNKRHPTKAPLPQVEKTFDCHTASTAARTAKTQNKGKPPSEKNQSSDDSAISDRVKGRSKRQRPRTVATQAHGPAPARTIKSPSRKNTNTSAEPTQEDVTADNETQSTDLASPAWMSPRPYPVFQNGMLAGTRPHPFLERTTPGNAVNQPGAKAPLPQMK